MGFLAFLFCCWFIWFLIQLSINDLKEQKKASRSKTNTKQNLNTQKTESPRSSRSQDYRNGMRIPTEDCICGCNGVPLTEVADYSIDYERYKICPARLKRKRTGTYRNDSGQYVEWIPAAQRRSQKRQKAKAKKVQVKKIKEQQAVPKVPIFERLGNPRGVQAPTQNTIINAPNNVNAPTTTTLTTASTSIINTDRVTDKLSIVS